MQIPARLVVATVFATLSIPAISQDKAEAPGQAAVVTTEPGKGTVANVIKATGVVEAVDAQKRELTLKGPNGTLEHIAVSPEVRNLDQVKVGDHVTVRYAQALSLTLMKDGKELRSKSESAGGERSKDGDKPGGMLGRKIEITADVVAVNHKTSMVTLRGPEHKVDLKVRDPAQLKNIKVGDQVQAVYSEAVVIEVAAPPSKKR